MRHSTGRRHNGAGPTRSTGGGAMRFIVLASLVLGLAVFGSAFASAANADTVGPITFEAPTYTVGNINAQNGWMKTGPYNVAVAPVSSFSGAAGYGFGTQAMQLSDAITSGSFGDQTFSPGLSQPAGESPAQTHFDASFSIGTALTALQPGLHMSVSPDGGDGSRMSYLRFEDLSDGVHVFFIDVTDSGPLPKVATFNETDIATLERTTAHEIRFSIDFKNGPANDIVRINIDAVLKATGTTWEDYYRFDPEQTGNGNVVPSTSKLLFRESGTANLANEGRGFLVDGVSLTSSASAICTPTGFFRDGINLTAAQIGGTVTGDLDAAGCNIGVYYNNANPGSVSGANISGANYFGVLVNGPSVDVSNSWVHAIGEVPLNGAQHGNAIVYLGGASGTISGNTVSSYQKNGITVSGIGSGASVLTNSVTGEGQIAYIAQNGIQISFGATALVRGNNVSGNWYTPAGTEACGLLLFQANGVKQQMNNLFANEVNFCNFGRGGGRVSP
jgi:hypothetical protein